MRKIIELDAQDIAQIIAEKYECDVKNVTVGAEQETRGCGMWEHDVTVCFAEIVLEE